MPEEDTSVFLQAIRRELNDDRLWTAWVDREHYGLTYKQAAAKRGCGDYAVRMRYQAACQKLGMPYLERVQLR